MNLPIYKLKQFADSFCCNNKNGFGNMISVFSMTSAKEGDCPSNEPEEWQDTNP